MEFLILDCKFAAEFVNDIIEKMIKSNQYLVQLYSGNYLHLLQNSQLSSVVAAVNVRHIKK